MARSFTVLSSSRARTSKSLCAAASFRADASSSSFSFCTRSSSAPRSSRDMSSSFSVSRRFVAFSSFRRVFSNLAFFTSSVSRFRALPPSSASSSAAARRKPFFAAFVSSANARCSFDSVSCRSRMRAMPRSASPMATSVSLLFWSSCSRNRARSASAARLARISLRRLAKSRDASRMAASRRFIDSMTSSHCRTTSWRSAWSARKSSAARSSSSCAAWVSETSRSSAPFVSATFFVARSMATFNSRTRASSARVYFSSASASSSFRADAAAHCSSSSCPQFSCSLCASSFSMPLCDAVSMFAKRSSSSSSSFSILRASSRTRAIAISESRFMCASVSFSLRLASALDCVFAISASTFRKCSRIAFTRSSCSSASFSSSSRTRSFSRIRRSSSRFSALANGGRKDESSSGSNSLAVTSPRSESACVRVGSAVREGVVSGSRRARRRPVERRVGRAASGADDCRNWTDEAREAIVRARWSGIDETAVPSDSLMAAVRAPRPKGTPALSP